MDERIVCVEYTPEVMRTQLHLHFRLLATATLLTAIPAGIQAQQWTPTNPGGSRWFERVGVGPDGAIMVATIGNGSILADGFESGDSSVWSSTVP